MFEISITSAGGPEPIGYSDHYMTGAEFWLSLPDPERRRLLSCYAGQVLCVWYEDCLVSSYTVENV